MKTKAFNGVEFQIDPEDIWILTVTKWRAQRYRGCHRVTGCVGNKTKQITRVIMGVEDRSLVVDHINHDTLDNRKSNLRVCRSFENARNRSPRCGGARFGYRGVDQIKKRYRATVEVLGDRHRSRGLGTPLEAAHEYDRRALLLHGEFAAINFPCTKSHWQALSSLEKP